MTGIQLVNLGEVLGSVTRSTESIKAAQMKCAKQQGIIAKQLMQAGCAVKTGAWQKSVGYHIEKISDLQLELTVGSNGAERYFFVQEATRHPLEIGWHQAMPQMADIYQKVITSGLLGKEITQNVDTSGIDEFSMMGGM